jgi:Fungal specific transcription factor domain
MKRYDWPNITILTCLLLLALHEFGTCYGRRSWALGGMAIRMAYTLQLHKDLEYDPMNRPSKTKLSFIDREVRRRTMWACFLMDRFTSSGSSRPMFMKEETIKAQLPIKERFFQLDIEGPTEDLQGNVPHPASSESGQFSDAKENMGVAAYTIRSLSVWGRIVIHLFQSGGEPDVHPVWDPKARFVELEKEAQEFVNNLPDYMKYTQENLRIHETEGLANQFLFLHLVSQQSILFLNHIGAYAGPTGRMPKEVPRDFVAKSKAKAFEAGRRISEFLKDAESHPVNAPFAGYCAFWSSSVQIPAVFSKDTTIEAAAKKNLTTNVRYLSKMKRYWGAFHWTSEHLKEQFRACADTARQYTTIVIGSTNILMGCPRPILRILLRALKRRKVMMLFLKRSPIIVQWKSSSTLCPHHHFNRWSAKLSRTSATRLEESHHQHHNTPTHNSIQTRPWLTEHRFRYQLQVLMK